MGAAGGGGGDGAAAWEAAPAVFFRPCALEDLDRVAALEASSYPPEEAAPRERLEQRLQTAGDYFLAAVHSAPDATSASTSPELVGFCCGTLTTADHLTHESMMLHEPEGEVLCIHSVCVDAAQRRRGVASRLLLAYAAWVAAANPRLRELRLICKAPLVGLYSRAGFTVVGPSDVVHGADPWTEMALALAPGGGGEGGELYDDWT